MTNPSSQYGTEHASVPDTQTVRRHPTAAAESRQPAGTQLLERRIMGIQPVLFVGMCLLAVVTLITVVLIFIGDFESQAPRVVWTVVVFLAFTGLLALDLVFARRSATPLVIGVMANTYLLAVLMIAIWVRGGRSGGEVDDDFGSSWLFAELLGIVLLTLLVVRAAAAGSWGLINLGKASATQFGRVLGLVAAGLLGLVGVLLTLHFAIDAFGIEVTEWYWRTTVAAIVVTALAASVTVLLFWNRRNLDWQAAEARGEHVRPAAPGGAVPPPSTWPVQGAQPRSGTAASAAAAASGAPTAWPQAAQSQGSTTDWSQRAQPAAPAAPDSAAPESAAAGPAAQAAPPQPTAPQQQAAPSQPVQQQAAQPDANGLLPWPTYPDGTPYPMGPDGQPVFPPYPG